MTPYRNNRLAFFLLIVFFLFIIAYAYFEARNILFGPQITLGSESALTVHEKLVVIEGSAQNITTIRMNGRTIPVTEEGRFEESLLLATGYNRVVFEAIDKFGREQSRILEITYVPQNTQSENHLQATTTQQTP